MFDQLVVVRGGGDLGSGSVLRLWRAGFPVVVLETANPIAVRRTVAFAEAVYDGSAGVEDAMAYRVDSVAASRARLQRCEIPVLVDPRAESLTDLQPRVVVDAIMAKHNRGTHRAMAPLVVGLGPGFTAGVDVHAVVETNRGPCLGRVIWEGCAEPNTGSPGAVAGRTGERVLRAPRCGRLETLRDIGGIVGAGEVVATVEGDPIRAAFPGLLRGLARNGIQVERGMKVGDIDPRREPELCRLVSDKALAIAGGVLESILISLRAPP